MELENKVALVTGGSSGLGLETVKCLLKKGMKVAVFDVTKNSYLENIEGKKVIQFNVDVRDAASVTDAVNKIKSSIGSLHLCVNCAGIAAAEKTLDKHGNAMPLDGFSNTISINLIGSFNVARCAAELMAINKPQGESGERGVIINTSSVAAFEGQAGQCGYAASKGGISSMTLPMARDLARHGIRVNTIAPGIMETDMLLAMPEKVQESLIENVEFPKRLGFPNEFSFLAVHIAENCYINGEVIRLDGGIRMSSS